MLEETELVLTQSRLVDLGREMIIKFRKWLNVGTVPTFKMQHVGTVPMFKMHHIGTLINQNKLSQNSEGGGREGDGRRGKN